MYPTLQRYRDLTFEIEQLKFEYEYTLHCSAKEKFWSLPEENFESYTLKSTYIYRENHES